MATITLTATGLTARTKTLSTADINRVLAAYKAMSGQVPDTAPGTFRDRTNQEVFDWFADKMFARIKEDSENIEGDTARKAVAPIVLT